MTITQRCSTLKAILLACIGAVTLMLGGSSKVEARRTLACEGDHGWYTHIMCADDRLIPGSYISSPNGTYRFYLGTGNAVIYDVSDFENPEVVRVVFQAEDCDGNPTDPDCAVELIYGDEFFPFAPAGFIIYNINGLGIGGYAVAGSGQHYMKLDNDGILRLYDEDDQYITVVNIA